MLSLSEIRDGFAQAIGDHPFITVDSLLGEVERGEAYVWVGDRAAVFWRSHEGRVIECGPMTGDPDEVMTVFCPMLDQWASEHGFKECYIQAGRRAWVRKLKPFGFAEDSVILRKHFDG